MTVVDLVLVGSILSLGAAVQSAVGFGMPIVVIPLLLLAGYPLPVATSTVFGAAAVQVAYGTILTRPLVRWRRASILAATQWVTLFAGVACMSLLVRSDPARARQVVGVTVLLAVTSQWIFRPTPRERLHPGWGVFAAGCGGFLGGFVGIGGPPLVLYALAHRWTPDQFRSFLWAQFLLVLPVLVAALAFRFGAEMVLWAALGLGMAPIVGFGSWLGRRLTSRWESERLQLAAFVLLYAIGIVSLVGH